MLTILKDKLWAYIVHNNPELMLELQRSYSVADYLDEKAADMLELAKKLLRRRKPEHEIVEVCLNELTKELRPSRYNYIRRLMKLEFPEAFKELLESGALTVQVITLIDACAPIFKAFEFCEANEDCPELYRAIIQELNIFLS